MHTLAPGAASEAARPLLAPGGARPRRETSSQAELSQLLDLLGHAAAVVRDGGRYTTRTRSLDDLLAADPGARVLLDAVRTLALRPAAATGPVRAVPADRAVEEDEDSPPGYRTVVHTARSRYALRRVDLCVGAQELTVVVVELADPASGVEEVLRTRYRLSAREVEVTRHLAEGRSIPEVAEMLGLSAHTARHHVERIYRKVEVHSRAELLQRLQAIEGGLRRRPFAG